MFFDEDPGANLDQFDFLARNFGEDHDQPFVGGQKIDGFGLPDLNGDGRHDAHDLAIFVLQQFIANIGFVAGTEDAYDYEVLSDPKSDTIELVVTNEKTRDHIDARYNPSEQSYEARFYR